MKYRSFWQNALLLPFLLCLCLTAYAQQNTAPTMVSLEKARQLSESGQVILIDVREAAEHAQGIVKGAKRLPLSELPQRMNEVPNDPKQSVLLICKTQNRSVRAATLLRNAGWTNVSYVEGGMSEWLKRGWPTVAP